MGGCAGAAIGGALGYGRSQGMQGLAAMGPDYGAAVAAGVEQAETETAFGNLGADMGNDVGDSNNGDGADSDGNAEA